MIVREIGTNNNKNIAAVIDNFIQTGGKFFQQSKTGLSHDHGNDLKTGKCFLQKRDFNLKGMLALKGFRCKVEFLVFRHEPFREILIDIDDTQRCLKSVLLSDGNTVKPEIMTRR